MIQPDRTLYLSPINPFTKAQARVLEQLANGKSQKEAATALGIAEKTVKNHLYGNWRGKKHHERSTDSQIGLFGVVERMTGERPCSETALVTRLIDDVLFFDEEPKGYDHVAEALTDDSDLAVEKFV